MTQGFGRRLRVALLCDVDQSVYHVGDEAIGLVGARQLAARGLDVVMVSRGEKHGPDGSPPDEAIEALTFPWPEVDRERYLDEIVRVLAGDASALPPEDKLHRIIEQIRGVDALVIGGGGSLNSRYGWLLYERAATALVASALGKPVVLTGQSVGPDLSVTDAEVLGRLLDACVLAGVRDADSLALARSVRPRHPALVQTLDDAVLLEGLDGVELVERISVTIGSDPYPLPDDDVVAVAASVVDGLADRTGAEIELVPHMADPDTGGGDLDMHERIAARLRHAATALPIRPAEETALRQAGSAWIVTTRFHPVVFGTASAASVLALPMNRYGRSRIDGALENTGFSGGSVPLAALWDPASGGPSALLDPVLDALVDGAATERAHLRSRRAAARERATAWWDRVAAALRGVAPAAGPAAVPDAQAGEGPVHRFDAPLRALLAPYRPGEQIASGASAQVGIIMRTQDRAVMLDRAVQDVLSQTRADWHLVIVDDAGSDPSGVDDVVSRYAHEAAGRITVLHRERSTGMEAASNAGIAMTEAPMLVVHDDDDTWQPTFLQRTAAYLRSHPEQRAVAVRTEIVHEHLEGTTLVEDARFPSNPELTGMHLVDFMAVNRITPIAVLYRRSAHDELGPFREDLPVVGDYEFHLRLLRRGPIGFLDVPLAQWRLRPRATGAASNSMYALSAPHAEYDARLADEQLRPWVAEHGIGLPMFVSRTVEERVGTALRPLQEQNERLLALLEETAARLAVLEDASRHQQVRLDERSAVDLARRTARSVRTGLHRAAGMLRRG